MHSTHSHYFLSFDWQGKRSPILEHINSDLDVKSSHRSLPTSSTSQKGVQLFMKDYSYLTQIWNCNRILIKLCQQNIFQKVSFLKLNYYLFEKNMCFEILRDLFSQTFEIQFLLIVLQTCFWQKPLITLFLFSTSCILTNFWILR